MFTALAHAEDVSMKDMATWADLTPIFIGGGIVVGVLFLIILYMSLTWEPKKRNSASKK